MAKRGPKPRPFTVEVVRAVLEAKSVRAGECVEWTGADNGYGYGQVWFSGRNWATHRLGWFVATGSLPPDDADVCHNCDNPPCWRADHIYLGDAFSNTHDMVERGRNRGPRPDQLKRGSALSYAKLDEQKVVAIRKAFAAGTNQRVLAERYGVSIMAISQARRGVHWTHVTYRD